MAYPGAFSRLALPFGFFDQRFFPAGWMGAEFVEPIPPEAPTGAGWSAWDIGCCCAASICGCSNVDNYVDDFSGTLEGWAFQSGQTGTQNEPTIVGGTLRFPWLNQFDDWFRCLIPPALIDVMLVTEFTIVGIEFLDELSVNVWLSNYDDVNGLCRVHGAQTTRIWPNLIHSVRAGGVSVPEVVIETEEILDGVVCRMEMENINEAPYQWEFRWYLDGILKHTATFASRPVSIFQAHPDIVTLHFNWDARTDINRYIYIDDLTFGVFPI
jgi:hypothetical protein